MNKIKVLLVEDETSLAMILSDTLEAQGFEMRTAHDGEEGLRMFAEQKPDVLVADVMMPKMEWFRDGAPYPQDGFPYSCAFSHGSFGGE